MATKSENKNLSTGLTLPTKKSLKSQIMKGSASAGAGAMTGAGEVVGEAVLGEVIGPLVGGVTSSLFVKDETLKKVSIFMGARKSARNMLI